MGEKNPDPEAGRAILRVEQQGAIECWFLNRPDKRNAISQAMLEAIHAQATALHTEHATRRALVITASGTKAFCAGADLKERAMMNHKQVEEYLDLFRESLWLIDRAPIPVLAAINGHALGGGLELALACDFRIATDDAKLGLPETSLGIIPGAGGTQRLRRLCGIQLTKRLILSAKPLCAKEAHALGLLDGIVPAAQGVQHAALDFLSDMLSNAPVAIQAALNAIDEGADLSLQHGLDLERRFYKLTLNTKDRSEALAAFAEKRKPNFTGH